jgi:hypothetical protein
MQEAGNIGQVPRPTGIGVEEFMGPGTGDRTDSAYFRVIDYSWAIFSSNAIWKFNWWAMPSLKVLFDTDSDPDPEKWIRTLGFRHE